MSFILDALKKSEHKRRAQTGEDSAALAALSEKKPAQRRQALQLLMIFLLLGILLLLTVLVVQRPWNATDSTAVPVTVSAEQPAAGPVAQSAAVDVPTPAPQAQRQVEVPAVVTQPQEDVRGWQQPIVDGNREAVIAVPTPSDVASPAATPGVAADVAPAPSQMTAPATEPVTKVAPPLAEDQVYSISDLPVDVRRRLPALQMALHAYNATDADASLVQINGRLVREGAQIAENLSVDEITSDGAILRTDVYRFLLPRRGQ